MVTWRHRSDRRMQRTGEKVRRPFRPLDDPALDELEERMLACPAADTPLSDR
jgi:hypothetical protein